MAKSPKHMHKHPNILSIPITIHTVRDFVMICFAWYWTLLLIFFGLTSRVSPERPYVSLYVNYSTSRDLDLHWYVLYDDFFSQCDKTTQFFAFRGWCCTLQQNFTFIEIRLACYFEKCFIFVLCRTALLTTFYPKSFIYHFRTSFVTKLFATRK